MERGLSPESHGDQGRATSHPIPIDRRLLNFGRRAELGPENGAVSSLDPSIAAHYEQGSEAQRLAGGVVGNSSKKVHFRSELHGESWFERFTCRSDSRHPIGTVTPELCPVVDHEEDQVPVPGLPE